MRVLLLLLLPAAAAAAIDASGPCDASFPRAPPGVLDALDDLARLEGTANGRRELRIALPNDRRAHAPLCRDPHNALRLDARRLDRCPAGNCYSCAHQQCFHLTSFECNAEVSISCLSRPTPRPTIRMVESVHPVKLTLKNVPRGYRVSKEVQSGILRWVSEMLKEQLVGTDLTLVKVAYAGRLVSSSNNNSDTVGVKGPRPDGDKENKGGRRLRGQRRLAQVDIALRVTVRGPEDEQEFALSYIMERVRAEFQDLVAYLKKNGGTVAISGIGGDVVGDASYGGSGANGGNGSNVIMVNPFDAVELGADSFDFADVRTGDTAAPSRRPTRQPSARPVAEEKVVVKVSGEGTNVVLEDTTVTIPWWAWLVLVLAILLLCICCVCGCVWRRRRNAKKREERQQQAINIWMGADGQKKRTSVADSRRTRRTSRPPKSIAIDAQSRRTSRRTSKKPPVSPRPVLRRSSTELEEEAREREWWANQLVQDAAPRDLDQSHSEQSVDPPEELALVPYSSKLVEPDGSKAPKNASLYADDVYYGGKTGALDGSNRSKRDPTMYAEESVSKPEPGGAKPPRVCSMYAADVYYAANGEASNAGSRKPRRDSRRPKRALKEDMFVCSLDELPEEASTAVRSQSQRALVVTEPDTANAVERKKKRTKKKRTKVKNETGEAGETSERRKSSGRKSGEGRKRRTATERLRSSLRMAKPQDVLNDASGDAPSIPTVYPEEQEEKKDEELSSIDHGKTNGDESHSDRYNESCATMSAGEHERRTESRLASRKKGSAPKRMPPGAAFASFTRRLSWKRDLCEESDDEEGSGGSLGSVDIGL